MFSYESLANLFNDKADDNEDDAPNFPWQGYGVGSGWPDADVLPVPGDDRPFFPAVAAEPIVHLPVELGELAQSMTVGRPLRLIRRAAFSGLA
jgi:hypothetical protein